MVYHGLSFDALTGHCKMATHKCGKGHGQVLALASSGYVRDFLMAAFRPKKLRGFGMYLEVDLAAVMVGTVGTRQ